jgi:hypothetical protein
MIGGADLLRWATLFADLPGSAPLGNGNGVTHAFANVDFAKKLLAMVPMPGVNGITLRVPVEREIMLEEEVRAARLMDGTASEDEEEEEKSDGDDEGAVDEADY